MEVGLGVDGLGHVGSALLDEPLFDIAGTDYDVAPLGTTH